MTHTKGTAIVSVRTEIARSVAVTSTGATRICWKAHLTNLFFQLHFNGKVFLLVGDNPAGGTGGLYLPPLGNRPAHLAGDSPLYFNNKIRMRKPFSFRILDYLIGLLKKRSVEESEKRKERVSVGQLINEYIKKGLGLD